MVNSSSISIEKIKEQTQVLLMQHGYFSLNQFPLPVEQIAKSLGYSVFSFSPKRDDKIISGAISKKRKEILISSEDPYERQRFTLAHEIGHAVLHFPNDPADSTFIDYRTPGIRTPRELEADEFAGSLLMPEDHFKKAWVNTNNNFYQLSKIFYVSQAAIGVRAFNLNLQ